MSSSSPRTFITGVTALSLFAISLLFSASATSAGTAGNFAVTGSMSTPRQNHAAVLLSNGEVLVAGGDDGGAGGATAKAEIYNPSTGTFSPTANSMTAAMTLEDAVLLPTGKVLVVDSSAADLFDPSTDSFSAAANPGLSGPFVHAVMLPTGKALVTDGITALLYDPSSGTFSGTGSLQVTRGECGVGLAGRCFSMTLLKNGKVLLAGGASSSNTSLASAELYDPSTGKFTLTGSMSAARENNLAALIGGSSSQAGDVLVTGGSDNGSNVNGSDLYNPSTGQFQFVNDAGTGDVGGTATTLQDGRVLVAGGLSPDFSGLGSYVYDPSTGTDSQTGSMNTGRAGHSAVLLNSGNVLVAGGFNNQQPSDSSALSSAELFEPSTSQFASAVSLVAPATGLQSGTITVQANINSNVQWVNFYIDGNYLRSGPPLQFSLDTTTLSDGTHALMVIGFTNSPTRTDLGSSSVVITVGNHQVGISSPAPGSRSISSCSCPSGECQAETLQTGPSVEWVDNYLDGAYQSSSRSPCIDMSQNGIHTLSTTGFASNGSVVGKDSIQLHVANAASNDEAYIVSPATGSGASATIPVSTFFASGVQWINLYIDGNYFASGPPTTFQVNTAKLTNGPHTISLRAFNSSDQQVDSDEIVINVLN